MSSTVYQWNHLVLMARRRCVKALSIGRIKSSINGGKDPSADAWERKMPHSVQITCRGLERPNAHGKNQKSHCCGQGTVHSIGITTENPIS
jgi:hypothetical protein